MSYKVNKGKQSANRETTEFRTFEDLEVYKSAREGSTVHEDDDNTLALLDEALSNAAPF